MIVNLLVLTLPLDEEAEVSIKSSLEARIAASSQSGALIAEDLGKKFFFIRIGQTVMKVPN